METNYTYLRMEAVVYVKLTDEEQGMAPKEAMTSAEERFLECLPEGMDCIGYKSFLETNE